MREPLVVLIGTHAHPEAAARLQAELRLLHFSIERSSAEMPGDPGSRWPEGHEQADALVFILDEPLRIVLWTRETNLTLQATEPRSGSDLLALQAVELLRGMLLPANETAQTTAADTSSVHELSPRLRGERRTAAQEGTSERRQPAQGEQQAARPAGPWGLFVGPQVAWGRGGVTPLPGFRATLSRRLLPWWGIELDGFSSAGAASARTAGGDLKVRAYSLGGGTSIHHRLHPRIESSLMLGFGAWGVSWQRASEIASLDVQEFRALPRASAELSSSFSVSSSAGIRFDGGLTYLMRRVQLEAPHPSEVIANQGGPAEDPFIGRLIWVGTLGLELRF